MPWSRGLLEKLIVPQLVKQFPTSYGTRRFIIAFTRSRHLSLFWAIPPQSLPLHSTSWGSILILSSHLRLGLPSGLVPSDFSTKSLHAPPSPPIHATCVASFILRDWFTRIIFGEEYRSLNSSLCSLFHSAGISFLDPSSFLTTLFSNSISLCSSLSLRDQVSHPYKTGSVMVLHIVIFMFLNSQLEDKRFCAQWQQTFGESSQLLLPVIVMCIFMKHCYITRPSEWTGVIRNMWIRWTKFRHTDRC